MSGVGVLVGTKKGAFILSSDGKRNGWKIERPMFVGWEIFHMKGSPADPNRIYTSQWTAWFGQLIQRSNDGGTTWEPVGNEFIFERDVCTHPSLEGKPEPWEFKRVWRLEPAPSG